MWSTNLFAGNREMWLVKALCRRSPALSFMHRCYLYWTVALRRATSLACTFSIRSHAIVEKRSQTTFVCEVSIGIIRDTVWARRDCHSPDGIQHTTSQLTDPTQSQRSFHAVLTQKLYMERRSFYIDFPQSENAVYTLEKARLPPSEQFKHMTFTC